MTRHDRTLTALAATVGSATLVIAASALPAAAATPQYGDAGHGAVFVQLNAPGGNKIAAYSRAGDGRLTAAVRYSTGGDGGTAVGAPVDALASQGSLTLADDGGVLLAVNAGSNSVTSFDVHGARLHRESLVASGGKFPVSVAVRGHLVYVLNGGGAGSVSGFRLRGAHLLPIPGSTRSLGLANTTPPAFLSSPAQVGISPDDTAVVVATKNNGTIEGFALHRDGRLSATPKITAAPGPVPFALEWSGTHTLYVAQAGDGRVVTYAVRADGSAVQRGSSDSSGQAALCWLVRVKDSLVGANPGSGTLSTWGIGEHGVATLRKAVAANPGGGPIDLAASRDGRFVYVQDATQGTVEVERVGQGAALGSVQTVTGLPVFGGGAGMEGIAAS